MSLYLVVLLLVLLLLLFVLAVVVILMRKGFFLLLYLALLFFLLCTNPFVHLYCVLLIYSFLNSLTAYQNNDLHPREPLLAGPKRRPPLAQCYRVL